MKGIESCRWKMEMEDKKWRCARWIDKVKLCVEGVCADFPRSCHEKDDKVFKKQWSLRSCDCCLVAIGLLLSSSSLQLPS
ncbi:hypothetical protein MPTK1_3g22760 [Marchantia polymorpha subsp. ruderalis]|uniref:Uncharacterized protein n=2 Tax=Marchantia polymorpha TaxID=3197 RepID=A0AAF6B3Q2_MARPO|nr:hypothetical protein MARPO_0024s0053 [Marchantia polymorpha]BBN06636.1 hypothetical protein Mp_3g22760 [Marchantia polymorpha subsp. ruderalis]|eukprot:PTQ43535.1 hypothetical protein MARPO_0024s0053 [Marchantia polymorpha]